jgi:cytochrome c553
MVVRCTLVYYFLSLFFFCSFSHASGNAERGKAQALVCAACHGQDGASGIAPTYPNLAGQNEKYLFNQLQMIASGERALVEMTGQLIGKTEQDLWDLAAYYASLPQKPGISKGVDAEIDKAASIYRGGIARKGVAACTACHSPTGQGNSQAGYPSIAGQSVDYTIAQLTAYRENLRKTDESFGGMMRGVAETLTDTEIAMLADYLRGLH